MPGPITSVGPILLNEPGDCLPRHEAAKNLGVDPGRFTAAIQLGSQRNFDYDDLPALIARELLDRSVQLVQIDNPLARPPEYEISGVVRCSLYPASTYLGAIDLMVTNAGYNSFHECVYGGIPAIFVPNESPEMDDQQLRATYADARASVCGSEAPKRHACDRSSTWRCRKTSARNCAAARRSCSSSTGHSRRRKPSSNSCFSVRATRPLHESLARV